MKGFALIRLVLNQMYKQGFWQFCKEADIFVKAPDMTYFWDRKAPQQEHSETLFPAFLETKYQFPRQDWSSLKFSLKSEIFNEQIVRDGRGGGDNRIFSSLSLRIYFL